MTPPGFAANLRRTATSEEASGTQEAADGEVHGRPLGVLRGDGGSAQRGPRSRSRDRGRRGRAFRAGLARPRLREGLLPVDRAFQGIGDADPRAGRSPDRRGLRAAGGGGVMRRRLLILGITVAALATIGLSMALSASAKNDVLSTVRSLTAKYQSVAQAEKNGYAPFYVCTEQPGVGTMGQHFVKGSLVPDG